ncbi:MAG: flagellar hook-associated protein FlgK [Sedimentitalea sp.]
MSLTSALHSAYSGLTAASRSTGVVSDNIANALTPGYVRRSLSLTSYGQAGPGVFVAGITRNSDPGIIANRRSADAEFGAAQVVANFHSRLTFAFGSVSDVGSVAMRMTSFESSLIEASSLPNSVERLSTAVQSAKDLAASLATASDTVQTMRSSADRSIDAQVTVLNQSLSDVQKLNSRITSTLSRGGETASLLDQRQVLLDQINEIVPINVVDRDHGQVALYSNGGVILLDGPAAQISFSPAHTVTPQMSQASGALSGLQLNGIPIRTDSANGALRGGTLGAQFQIRDEIAPEVQEDIDSVARDLVERFEDPSLDSTLAAGAPGLFTDNGSAFDVANEVGLAGRLSLNASVDPDQGGESWRLRDGLGALVPGAVGNSQFLQDLGNALNAARTPGSGNFGTGQLTAAGVVSTVLSRFSQQNSTADQNLSFASASQTELTQIELAQGVDTDSELQTLMLAEQAYAANARMIEVVQDMMDTLLRI